jgi:hypothetical protein
MAKSSLCRSPYVSQHLRILTVACTDILVLAISVTSAAIGFAFGAAAHRCERESHERPEQPTKTEEKGEGDEPSDDEGSVADGNLSAVTAGFLQPCKLVSDFWYSAPKLSFIDYTCGAITQRYLL